MDEFWLHDCIAILPNYQILTDDRRTDGHFVAANTALCIASRGYPRTRGRCAVACWANLPIWRRCRSTGNSCDSFNKMFIYSVHTHAVNTITRAARISEDRPRRLGRGHDWRRHDVGRVVAVASDSRRDDVSLRTQAMPKLRDVATTDINISQTPVTNSAGKICRFFTPDYAAASAGEYWHFDSERRIAKERRGDQRGSTS